MSLLAQSVQPTGAVPTRRGRQRMRNFDDAPFLVIWEVTQACDLACVHCRASAQSERHYDELTTEEGFALLRQIRSFGDPLLVFTGGDPLKRPDLFNLMNYAVSIGLRTTVTPSATPLLTAEAIRKMKDSGIARMAVSLDGPDAETHDHFRGVPGTFDRAMEALRVAQEIGLETQINTTVTRYNIDKLQGIAEILRDYGCKLWSVFFLIPTGRAQTSDDLTAEEYERVFGILYETSKNMPFDVKTTEAQFYRRYVAQRRKAEGAPVRFFAPGPVKEVIQRSGGINDGKGFVFVSHRGDVYPSGFLPKSGGNVRQDSLPNIYRNAPMFKELRNPSGFEGKCGYCEYRNLCGGSRARAYALTGDYLNHDPRCVYQPKSKDLVTIEHPALIG
jgi:AdoMet-dependent heme synthase